MENTPTQDSTQKSASPAAKQENPIWNLLFNIVIPVLILNKGSNYLSPIIALLLALSFPLIYGLIDFLQKKKTNFLSILGLINISVTGGLALIGIEGHWFAVKEAAFPALIGLFVFGSAFTKKPFVETLFLNPQIINTELLKSKISELNNDGKLKALLKNATLLLSISFALSAALNFALAIHVFLPIDSALNEAQHTDALNQQIAEMTKWSFLVILIPSLIFLSGIFYYLLNGLKKISGLTTEEIIPQ